MAAARTVMVVGGGYGGLACIRGLAGSRAGDFRVVLMDANPFHAIKTRFHERAVSTFREPGLRLPLELLSKLAGADFILDQMIGVDVDQRKVQGRSGEYPFDILVLAMGARSVYFGIPGAEENSISLQSYAEAARCANTVEALIKEAALRERRHVVVAGAGVEGIEFAAQLSHGSNPERVAITVVERSEKILALSAIGEAGRDYTKKSLQNRGVALALGKAITGVTPGSITLEDGRSIRCELTVWCSGQRPVHVEGLNGDGLKVDRHLRHPEYPWLFAIGDFAYVDDGDKNANLTSAQRAVYQGEVAAENILRFLDGKPLAPSNYRPKGEMIALGDTDGVGILFGAHVTGLSAAAIKKVNEARYLAMAGASLPNYLARSLLGLHRSRQSKGKP